MAILGGVGLFLLGIILLTDALKLLAGESLRRGLARLTGTRTRAFATGLGVTAVIQSASATILMTLGLASAGLLALPLTLAIILGANIGTTSTVWLVATIGLRVSITEAALVMVGVGAFLRLLLRGTPGAVGQVTAGFGVLFVGIAFLRDGMEAAAPTLAGLGAGDSGLGRMLLLVGAGLLTTVIAQSNTVTVSATVAAVHAGGLPVVDGALLIVGQNIGTTITTVLGGLGTGAAGRRMALGHVVMNSVAALAMFALFWPLLRACEALAAVTGGGGAVTLAAFHTGFNLVVALMFLPIVVPVANLAERAVRDRGPRLAAGLDPVSARVPGVAVDIARRAMAEVAAEALGVMRSRLDHGRLMAGTERRLEAAEAGLRRVHAFLARLHTTADAGEHTAHLRTVHAADHLERIVDGCRDPSLRASGLEGAGTRAGQARLREAIAAADEWLRSDLSKRPDTAIAAFLSLQALRQQHRTDAMTGAALGQSDFVQVLAELDVFNWARQQAHHLARLLHYLAPEEAADPDEGAGATTPEATGTSTPAPGGATPPGVGGAPTAPDPPM